jgi:hypothetical protein
MPSPAAVSSSTTITSHSGSLLREPYYENITPVKLKEKIDRGEEPVLLDVRETWELALANRI